MSVFSPAFDGDRLLLKRLRDRDIQKIHFAALEIAERTGMRFFDEQAVALLKKAGCRISEGNRVRIPSHLLEWALRIAPKRILLCNRDGSKALALQDFNSYYGPGSDCLQALDHRSGLRRRALLSDVVEGIKVVDALSGIDFAMSLFLPSDVPHQVYDRYQMEAMLNGTTKPMIFVTYDLQGCQDAVEMAEVVAGGPEALQANPHICCYINVATALRHNAEAVQKLIFLAGKGLPCLYLPSQGMRGILTPVTFAGNLAMNCAGQLAGLLLAQLVREGAPVIPFHGGGTSFDLRSNIMVLSGPETRAFRSDLAHFYGLPSFGTGGATMSKLPDEQAAAEAGLTLLTDTLAGATLIHDVGFLEGGQTYSLELLAMCNDLIGWVKRLIDPVSVNEETLALEVIHAAGPDGQYLEADHTLRHCREDWHPKLLDRHDHQGWLEAGGTTYRERARKRLDDILEAHRPAQLDETTRAAVRAVLQRAAERAGVSLPV